ncbi:hypothetical protein NZK33_01985 [Cyanobium sp. FGCU-6]|nr:hypothetical protein [Cyanobium sp. FGCU6]
MAVATVSAAMPLAAQAGPTTSLNATQLSVTVAPISVTGTTLGASVNALGSGLTNGGVVPTIDATGALTVGNAMAAAANTSFNLSVTARAADTAPVATQLSNTQGLSNSAFGSQSGAFSSTSDSTLAITGTVATVAAGTGIGSSASASFTTTLGTSLGDSTVRKIATSTNNQSTFTAERQGAKFQAGGSGLEAVTAGGLGTTALGATPTITPLAGGNTQADVAFTFGAETRTGQAAVAANSTGSTALAIPAYGDVTATYGGTTAGAISPTTNINTLGVSGGGAGTSSSLSLVQSLTVFGGP